MLVTVPNPASLWVLISCSKKQLALTSWQSAQGAPGLLLRWLLRWLLLLLLWG